MWQINSQSINSVCIIIKEDLLKINKVILRLIQLFTSAWRDKNTERKEKKKIRQAVVYTTFAKRKTKLKEQKKKKKKKKPSHTNIYKINTSV